LQKMVIVEKTLSQNLQKEARSAKRL
jgi:hypothetical protein